MISHQQLAHPPIKASLVSHSGTNHSVMIEPLLPGFGYTLGNSLRRVLLSYVPGFAVTKVQINDLTHEYQSIDGVVEDAMDVILNLKLLRAKILTDDESVTLTLSANSEGDVTAASFGKDAKVRIVNPDLYICSLNKKSKLNLEVTISRGVGYQPIEEVNIGGNVNPMDIYVDAVFSPVTNVNFDVEQVRVGDKTNYDKIQINFDTDKSVEPQEIVDFVMNLLVDQFSKMKSSFESAADMKTYTAVTPVQTTVDTTSNDTPSLSSDSENDIDLPSRIKNILEKNGITNRAALKSRIEEIEDLPGIGESAMEKINEYVTTL